VPVYLPCHPIHRCHPALDAGSPEKRTAFNQGIARQARNDKVGKKGIACQARNDRKRNKLTIINYKKQITMRTKILVFSVALVLSANLHAQVTIGSANAPKEGAILDLNSDAKGGLILSNVNINDPEVIPSGFAGMDGVDIATAKAQLPGTLVYNLNDNTCTGILVWDGVRWKRLGLEENPATGTQRVKIISPEESQILGGDVITFEIESPPADTKMYTCYVSENGGAYEYAVTRTTNSFSKEFAAGNYRVKAVLDDCRSLEASLEKSFMMKSVSPDFGHTGGGNIVYIYGDFPYAATSDYVQDNLVVHYDAINNQNLGDKSHSYTATIWKDLKNTDDLPLLGIPASGDGWKTNAFKFSTDTYFGDITVPASWPQGNADRTV
jgi:hypothetical protein